VPPTGARAPRNMCGCEVLRSAERRAGAGEA
jgi:hypothetical protein